MFCSDYPFVTLNFTQSSANTQIGIAAGDYGTLGISLSAQGFTLSSSSLEGVTSALNTIGLSYCYIALK